ncbi:MAG: ethanolamine permease [Pirellulales bacterium]|nr:ethanolamine permease [Pirellulales bacterium]
MAANSVNDDGSLRKDLGPWMLWGLGVGYVISGEYFGWNLGLPLGGAYGLLLSFALVTLMYVAFVFSYAEMACAIPRAGGAFVYAARGLGPGWGYLAGLAQVIEFVFAPPAIALAIGAYVNTAWPAADPRMVAIGAYVLFTALNIWGVKQAARFELIVTLLAVGELLLFSGVVAPSFRWERFAANAWPHGLGGALRTIPFAIWFYLAIEGVANAAEEARNPQRDVALGFGSAMLTLVVLAAAVLFLCVGVDGWERVVYASDALSQVDGRVVVAPDAAQLDKPLPLALEQVVPPSHPLYRLLIGVGLLGLVASFNGILLVAGRAIFDMGRAEFLPGWLGRTHAETGTPVIALLVNLSLGILAIFFVDTAGLITLSALGALFLYIVSMAALVALRKREPELARPYRTPAYPLAPAIAGGLAVFCLATLLYFNFHVAQAPSILQRWLSGWFVALLALGGAHYLAFVRPRLDARALAHFHRKS